METVTCFTKLDCSFLVGILSNAKLDRTCNGMEFKHITNEICCQAQTFSFVGHIDLINRFCTSQNNTKYGKYDKQRQFTYSVIANENK